MIRKLFYRHVRVRFSKFPPLLVAGSVFLCGSATAELTGEFGALTESIRVREFPIPLEAGEFLSVIVVPMPSDGGSRADVQASVWSPDGLRVVENDDAGFLDPDQTEMLGSVVRYRAFQSGVHQVKVSGSGDTDYTGTHSQIGEFLVLKWWSDPEAGASPDIDPDFAPPGDLAGGALVLCANTDSASGVAQLSPSGDEDVYRVDLAEGDILTALVTPLAGENLFETPDTVLRLESPAGELLVQNDDAGRDNPISGYGSALYFEAQSAGTHELTVSGFVPGGASPSGSGLFGLAVHVIRDDSSPGPGTPPEVGLRSWAQVTAGAVLLAFMLGLSMREIVRLSWRLED